LKCDPYAYVEPDATTGEKVRSVSSQEDPIEDRVKIQLSTQDLSNVGIQEVSLHTSLGRYPNIRTSTNFKVVVFNFVKHPLIRPQKYSVGSPVKSFQHSTFVLSPRPSSVINSNIKFSTRSAELFTWKITVFKIKQNTNSDRDTAMNAPWLTYDPVMREIKVETTDIQYVG